MASRDGGGLYVDSAQAAKPRLQAAEAGEQVEVANLDGGHYGFSHSP